MFEAPTFAPLVETTDILKTPRYSHIELNTGEHIAINQAGLAQIQERFHHLGEKLETHLNAGGKVVFLMEEAYATFSHYHKINELLSKGLLLSLALPHVNGGRPIKDRFISEMVQMADIFIKKYPEQFTFKYEYGSDQRVNETRKALQNMHESHNSFRNGNFIQGLDLFKQYRSRFIATSRERDVAIADQINNIINEVDDPNLFVVALFGSDHASGISHNLLMRGLVSNTVEADSPIENFDPAREEGSELQLMQRAIADVWMEDRMFFIEKNSDESAKIINEIVSRYLQSDEDIREFQSLVVNDGWFLAILKIYTQWETETSS